ncbi:MAG: uroporphyrinogen-III synthase [Halioglobus sp.]|nr:uroporphyrinogen-III synthase [Halioglobus sp.]
MPADGPAVLVTRPAGEAAERLVAAIEAAGLRVVHQPLLELEPIAEPSADDQALLRALADYQHVIFVSANAVRFGMLWLQRHWPVLPQPPLWYAVGDATAALLAEQGVEVFTPGRDMTSEGLLALPGLRDVAGARVLIVKGEGGRDTLATELAARGATVAVLACYRRVAPVLPAGALGQRLEAEKVAAVLLSSGEGLENFRRLLSPSESSKFTGLRLIVPSDRVAKLAREAGFDNIVTADNASDAAMCRALGVNAGE